MERGKNGDRIGKGALSKGQECVKIVYKWCIEFTGWNKAAWPTQWDITWTCLMCILYCSLDWFLFLMSLCFHTVKLMIINELKLEFV